MWSWLIAAAFGAPNIVLISMDTTRVDALSCYREHVGPARWETQNTPVLDAFAAEGTRFLRFYANAPTTLNSHTTMFTGLDPHEHGVVRNGYPFEGDESTLAERLALVGYDTIAVLGSAALEKGMGLTRGFRVYDDKMPRLRSIMFQDDAEGVVKRTLAHLDERNNERPLFLFVHLYDAHAPYNPPHRIRERFVDPEYHGGLVTRGPTYRQHLKAMRKDEADPADTAHIGALYLSEVAFIDEQIGVLLDDLGERGLLDEALVVVTADHGETLADDPRYAYSHGSNVEEDVMHVPLLIRGFGVPVPEGVVIASQAAMPGLAPTIERLVGLERTLGKQPDFYRLLQPGPVWDEDGWPERPTLPAYVEASRPRTFEATNTWNNLPLHRGVFAGGYGFWVAPFMKDSPTGWYAADEIGTGDLFGELHHRLVVWDDGAPPHRPEQVAPATAAALKVLGYTD